MVSGLLIMITIQNLTFGLYHSPGEKSKN